MCIRGRRDGFYHDDHYDGRQEEFKQSLELGIFVTQIRRIGGTNLYLHFDSSSK